MDSIPATGAAGMPFLSQIDSMPRKIDRRAFSKILDRRSAKSYSTGDKGTWIWKIAVFAFRHF
jgi:hypothetical protein